MNIEKTRVVCFLKILLVETFAGVCNVGCNLSTLSTLFTWFRRRIRRFAFDILLTSLITRRNRSRICEGRKSLDGRQVRSEGNDYVFHPVVLASPCTFRSPDSSFPVVTSLRLPSCLTSDCYWNWLFMLLYSASYIMIVIIVDSSNQCQFRESRLMHAGSRNWFYITENRVVSCSIDALLLSHLHSTVDVSRCLALSFTYTFVQCEFWS